MTKICFMIASLKRKEYSLFILKQKIYLVPHLFDVDIRSHNFATHGNGTVLIPFAFL